MSYLRELPIRRIDFANPGEKQMHDHLMALVERMLDLHKRKPALSALRTPYAESSAEGAGQDFSPE